MTKQEFQKFVEENVYPLNFVELHGEREFLMVVFKNPVRLRPVATGLNAEPSFESIVHHFCTRTLHYFPEADPDWEPYAMLGIDHSNYYKIPIEDIEFLKLWEGDEEV